MGTDQRSAPAVQGRWLTRFTTDKPDRPIIVRVVVLIGRVMVAGIVLAAGIGKLLDQPAQAAMFENLGGTPMQYTVGVFEILGGIAVLVPILSGIAAGGLTVLFVIIVAVTAVVFGPSSTTLAVVVLLLSAALAYMQRHQNVRLVRTLRRKTSPY